MILILVRNKKQFWFFIFAAVVAIISITLFAKILDKSQQFPKLLTHEFEYSII